MTVAEVIRWWELRRLLYNAVLLAVGVATISGMEWLMGRAVPVGKDAVEPMALVLGVLVYGFMANLSATRWMGHRAVGAKDRSCVCPTTWAMDVPGRQFCEEFLFGMSQ
jgi:hypothetical protein